MAPLFRRTSKLISTLAIGVYLAAAFLPCELTPDARSAIALAMMGGGNGAHAAPADASMPPPPPPSMPPSMPPPMPPPSPASHGAADHAAHHAHHAGHGGAHSEPARPAGHGDHHAQAAGVGHGDHHAPAARAGGGGHHDHGQARSGHHADHGHSDDHGSAEEGVTNGAPGPKRGIAPTTLALKAKCVCGCDQTRSQVGGGAARLGSVVLAAELGGLEPAPLVVPEDRVVTRWVEVHFDADHVPI